MKKYYGSDWTLLPITRQTHTLSAAGILVQTQESLSQWIFHRTNPTAIDNVLLPVNLKASLLTNNEDNLLAV